jgi:hypothetical protein
MMLGPEINRINRISKIQAVICEKIQLNHVLTLKENNQLWQQVVSKCFNYFYRSKKYSRFNKDHQTKRNIKY